MGDPTPPAAPDFTVEALHAQWLQSLDARVEKAERDGRATRGQVLAVAGMVLVLTVLVVLAHELQHRSHDREEGTEE